MPAKTNWKTIKYGNQVIKESPSGKTWEFFVRHATWFEDKERGYPLRQRVGIRKEIALEANKKFGRRIKFNIANPCVDFTIPVWEVISGSPIMKKVFNYPNRPMRLYMVEIPWKKLEETRGIAEGERV